MRKYLKRVKGKNMKKLGSILVVLMMCLTFGTTVKAAAGLTEVIGSSTMENATPISYNVDYVSAKDGEDMYYKFTTPAKKAYYFLYVKNINIAYSRGDFYVKIENAYGEKITGTGYDVDSPNESTTLQTLLEPATTYYIHANGSNNGNFRMYLSYNEDNVGDTMDTSTKVSLNSNVTGTIDGDGDVDCYCFQTGNYKDYVLNFKNLSGERMTAYVYNQYGEVLTYEKYIYSYNYDGVNLYLNNLAPNTKYYVKTYSYYSGYWDQKYLFKVSPNRIAIQDTTISYKTTYTYSGKTIQPGLTVTYNGTTLSKGKDYTVTYSNNKKPGRGKITIKGLNGYTGTVTKKFDILPKRQKIKKLTNVSGRKLKVSYTKESTATGYEIQISPFKNFIFDIQTVNVKGKKNSAKTIKNLTKNKTYYVRVRTYVKSGSTTVSGAWSSVKKIKIKK